MKKFTLALLLLVIGLTADAQTITRIIGASPFQDSLWVFDTTNFNVVRRLAPTPSAGGSITGTNGIAMDPSTGIIYVVCKQSAVSGRILGTLDPLTGVVTIVGNLGDNFSSITFNGNNTLLGVTGDGASTPETVYRIDKTNANKTVLRAMGNGADGEIICYNPADNMIYHWSGNGTVVYEKMDTSGVTITNIPIIGTTNGETFGAVYRSNNTFITSNISSRFQTFGANGTSGAMIGTTSPDDIRGLSFLTCSRAITGATILCSGDSVLLTHGSAGAVSYQWYLDNILIAGATSQTYFATSGGHYNCIVGDACGTDSLGAGINVLDVPLPVTTVTGNSVFCAGDSSTLTGTGGGTYQWYMNGSPIGGATMNTFEAHAAGLYNMLLTDMNGCSDSANVPIQVTVNPLPTPNLGPDTTVCGSIVLDPGSTPGGSYIWCDGSTTQTITFNTSGTCAVFVTDPNGCMNADTITVIVNALPVVDLGADTTVCGGSTLDAQNSGSTYLWSDSTVAQMLSATATGTYYVDVTDANGCFGTDTVNVIVNTIPFVIVSTPDDSLCPAQPAVTLTTSPAGGTLAGPGISGSQFTAFNAGSGTHIVTYMYTDANGCSATDSLTMFVFPTPNVTLNASDNNVCTDDADVTLTGSPAGGMFMGPGVSGNTFDPSVGTGAQTVTYIYTDANGCNFATATTITVNACVGIAEQTVTSFTMSPNPASGNVQLTLPAGTSTVVIFNALGETIRTATLTEGAHTLDLSAYPAGMYIVRVQGANGVSSQRLMLDK